VTTSGNDRWIRGVAALEPTFVRNDEAAVALTWLAASPEDLELHVVGRYRSTTRVGLRDTGPEAVVVFADGSELLGHSRGASAGSETSGWCRDAAVLHPLPEADVVAVELAWPVFRLRASLPLPPSILRDAAARAVRRG
jgi:hypothetical protein